jgi:hypothetical protein
VKGNQKCSNSKFVLYKSQEENNSVAYMKEEDKDEEKKKRKAIFVTGSGGP